MPSERMSVGRNASQCTPPTDECTNLPECQNKNDFMFSFGGKLSKKTPSFNERKKKKHFLYPYRDVIRKPASCILADDLLTLALDMELQTHVSTRRPAPDFNISSKRLNAQQHAAAGLIAFSNLHREKMRSAVYEAENSMSCNAERLTSRKSVLTDSFLFDRNRNGTLLGIIRMMLKGNVENDDEETARRVIQRLRKINKFDIADIVQRVYSIYILTKRIHLGSVNELSYRRNVIMGFVSLAEQTFPRSRFSFEFVGSAFDSIAHDFHFLAEIGVPMRCVKALYSNALARPLFTEPTCVKSSDMRSGTSRRRALSSESLQRMTVDSSHRHDAIRNIERESGFSLALTINDECERLGVRIENYGDALKVIQLTNGNGDAALLNFGGFLAASGKKFNLEKYNAISAKRRYQDMLAEDELVHVDLPVRSKVPSPPPASSSRIVRQRFELDDGCCIGAITADKYESNKFTNFSGFKTGTGKSISVNAASLEMSNKKLLDMCDEYAFTFDDISFSVDGKKRDIKLIKTEPKITSRVHYGEFKTAAGQLIDARADTLEASGKNLLNVCDKYKTLYDEFAEPSDGCNEQELASIPFRPETNPNVPLKEAHYGGFKTGAGKLINVRAESFEASKKKFLDENISASSAVETEMCHGGGFKTGAGKSIDVRAESLNASKRKFFQLQKKIDADKSDDRPLYLTGAERTITDPTVCPIAAFALPECMTTKVVATDTINSTFEAESPCVHFADVGECELSFDLSREITESTSAFLYDVSNDETCSFTPRTADTSATENTLIDPQQKPAVRASPGSPVLASSFSRKARYAKKYQSPVHVNSALYSPHNPTDSSIYLRRTRNTSTPVDTVRECAKRKQPAPSPHCMPAKKLKFSATLIATASDDDVMERRQRAAVGQQRYVDHKPPEFCKPFAGYYSTRISNVSVDPRLSLEQLAQGEKPKTFTIQQYTKFGLLPTVLEITSRNAGYFVFTKEFISEELLKNGDCPVLFGDAAPVILNSRNEITLEEITRAFLASPGVDPRLVSRAWIANHYRWIVWKLASTERSFPYAFGGRYLTLNNVLFQLKFRYDREIDGCIRSALKRILEGDDSPAKPLILCIAAIEKTSQLMQQYKIELTDGWYGIFAEIDEQMNKLIARRKLVVGTKLIVTGAELVGWSQGRDPLNTDDCTRLKFSTNSCRRVRWYTRMGFHVGRISPFCRINTLLPNGGLVSHLSAVVARVYPLLFLEKYDDHSAAAHIHNEKVENKRIADYEKQRLAYVEEILPRITSEVLRENYSVTADSVQQLDSQEADLNNYNYEDRDKLRLIIQERIESRLPEKFSKKRNVSRLLKLRLVDPKDENLTSAILTIWNPSNDVIDFFKEEKMYSFYNLHTNGIRGGDLLLSSNRLSKYDECSPTKRPLSGCCCTRRCVTRADELRAKKCISAFDEVDMVGVVVKICWHEDRRLIYLTDLAGNFFAVSFRIDEKNFDYGDVIKRGKIIAGVNLQWKKGFLFWSIPILFASEYSLFVQSTRRQTLQRSIEELVDHFKRNNLDKFIEEYTQKLDSIARLPEACTTISAAESNDDVIRNVSVKTTIRDSIDQNSSSSCHLSKENLNRVNDPNRCATLSRIEKLQNYGEPPPLSPITLTSRLAVKNKLHLQRKTLK